MFQLSGFYYRDLLLLAVASVLDKLGYVVLRVSRVASHATLDPRSNMSRSSGWPCKAILGPVHKLKTRTMTLQASLIEPKKCNLMEVLNLEP